MSENPYENLFYNLNNTQSSAEFSGNKETAQQNIFEEEVLKTDESDSTVANTQQLQENNFRSYDEQKDEPFVSVGYELPRVNASPQMPYHNTIEAPRPVVPVYQQDYTQSVNDMSKSQRTKKKSRTPLALILLLCMIVSSVFGGGSAFLVYKLSNKNTSGLTVNKVSPDSQTEGFSAQGELSTVDIVDKYADSVVEIITESVTTGVFSQQYIQSGAGSGVIIDSNGYIVTNHHVIDGARKISVTLRNGKSYSAQLVGSDAKEDLALLKIEGENLVSAVVGDSDTLKVGQRTIAIGNPLGQLGGTVTEGIISALDRELVVDGQTMNLMQTDTAINPGNSGGGMFDGKGNLIGIVVAKSSGSEVEGLGFAIPINDALLVISDLMEYGYVRGRVDIGIEFVDVTSEAVAWMYGLSETGCYINRVSRNTNAEEAGFRSGDLVLQVDGKDISTSDDIEKILESKKVGDQVEFSIKRNSNKGKVVLVLEEDIPDAIRNQTEDDDLIQWYN